MSHPITPPLELRVQWIEEDEGGPDMISRIAAKPAQWGADQELEACLGEVSFLNSRALADRVRTARRPKPPSLKEQALEQLDGIAAVFLASHGGNLVCDTIRRALESIPDPS